MIVDIIHYKTDDGTIFNAKEDAIYHEKTLLLKELLLEITKSGSRCQCVDKITVVSPIVLYSYLIIS